MVKSNGIMKSTGTALAAIALCGLALAPGFAAAAEAPQASEKDETVYIYTTANGSVKNTEVETVLKNPDGLAEIGDASTLEDLKGKNDVGHTGSGESIIWQASGENVTYTGATSLAAPVTISASYMLDGQVIAPDQLAGKSGHVTIRYDFANHSATTATVNGVTQTIYTPFTCITAIMLDGKDFKNVTVENGKVINDGNDMIVAGYAMPGLKESLGTMAEDADVPDHFTVEADVSDFELKSTMTIVTAGLMSDFDADSLGLGDFDGASALSDAMGQLISGSDKLTSGLDELASNLKQLEASASTMSEGAVALSDGLYALAGSEGLGALSSGASALSKGIDVISTSVSAIPDSLSEASSALGKASTAADFEAALTAVKKHEKDLGGDYATIVSALQSGQVLATTATTVSASLNEAKTQFDEKLMPAIARAKEGAAQLASGSQTALDSANELSYYGNELKDGAALLNAAMPQFVAGAQAAAEGSKTLTQGMQAFNDQGVSQLVDTLQSDYGGMLDRMNALSDAAKAYTNFGGITPGTAGSVKFVIETDAITKN